MVDFAALQQITVRNISRRMSCTNFRTSTTAMRFSTDEIKPFYELRQSLSKAIDEVERDSGEIVIAKHGKPVAALLSAAGLYRYRELDRLMVQLLDVLKPSEGVATIDNTGELASLTEQAQALLAGKGGEHE
jgi:prevent-host-death family protein